MWFTWFCQGIFKPVLHFILNFSTRKARSATAGARRMLYVASVVSGDEYGSRQGAGTRWRSKGSPGNRRMRPAARRSRDSQGSRSRAISGVPWGPHASFASREPVCPVQATSRPRIFCKEPGSCHLSSKSQSCGSLAGLHPARSHSTVPPASGAQPLAFRLRPLRHAVARPPKSLRGVNCACTG